jgi:hypothetical protein
VEIVSGYRAVEVVSGDRAVEVVSSAPARCKVAGNL